MLIYLKHNGQYLGFRGSTAELQFSPHTAPAPFAYKRGIEIRSEMAEKMGIPAPALEVEVAFQSLGKMR